MDRYPHKLFEGCDTGLERAARIGRYEILQEMGFFGEDANIRLARHAYEGTFNAAVQRHFSNTYGDLGGCALADIEVAAEMRGVFDDVYDVEASDNTRHLQDKR